MGRRIKELISGGTILALLLVGLELFIEAQKSGKPVWQLAMILWILVFAGIFTILREWYWRK